MTTKTARVDEFDRERLVAVAQRTVDINAALDRLVRDFRGIFNRETIERFIYDSAARLGEAKVTTYVPIIAERFAKERLKALARVEGRMLTTVPSVLFLCTHNAGRSQMAAGWVKQLAGDRVLVWSGGSDPTSEVNTAAVEAMNEVGIDIAQEFPKPEWTRAAACSAVAGTMVFDRITSATRCAEQPRRIDNRLRRRPPGGRCGAAPPGHARPDARRQLPRPR